MDTKNKRSNKKKSMWVPGRTEMESLPDFRNDCLCTKKNCERHGYCIICYQYHSGGKRPPYCLG